MKKGGGDASKRQVKDLQRDLRCLGYLKSSIDGKFGNFTLRAVKALQHELLYNDGENAKNDGSAPVMVLDYNRKRVIDVTGIVDQNVVACISDMLDDPYFPLLPKSENPEFDNSKIANVMCLSERILDVIGPMPCSATMVRA